MQDLSVWVDQNGNRILGSCPPESTTTLDLIRTFVRYGRSHDPDLPSNAALALTKAFQHAFPCEENRSSIEIILGVKHFRFESDQPSHAVGLADVL
jgi:hypothetical protein